MIAESNRGFPGGLMTLPPPHRDLRTLSHTYCNPLSSLPPSLPRSYTPQDSLLRSEHNLARRQHSAIPSSTHELAHVVGIAFVSSEDVLTVGAMSALVVSVTAWAWGTSYRTGRATGISELL
eukprot:753028-Hanusia_phi.AAC.5